MNHRSSVFAAAALAALTACTSTVDVPPMRPFAFLDVNLVDSAAAPSHLAVRAQGIFTQARITGVIGSDQLTERCNSPANIADQVAYTQTPLDPGTVTMTLHGNVDTTTRTVPLQKSSFLINNQTEVAYHWVGSSLPPVNAGTDTVIYSATGVAGGFPPFTLRAPTVATYVPQPVDDSVTGTGLRIQWTPSTNSATAMQIALQFANDSSKFPHEDVNREIVCIARDDGDFSIPRAYVADWEQAGVDSLNYAHRVIFSRFLTTATTINDAIVTVVVRRDTMLVK